MIPEAFIEKVVTLVPLSRLISSDGIQLRGSQSSQKGLCPFHDDTKPSFQVSDNRGTWRCWVCDKGGDAIDWLTERHGLEFPAAIERLAAEAGLTREFETITHRDAELTDEMKWRRHAFNLQARLAGYFHYKLLQHDPALQYLAQRGITRSDIDRFELGWSPDSSHRHYLHHALKRVDHTELDLTELGLARHHEQGGLRPFFTARIMFPIRDAKGRVLAFAGRAMTDVQPKYINSPETPLYRKGDALFGLAEALQLERKDLCLAVEGYTDVIALQRIGVPAVAIGGVAISTCQVRTLLRHYQRVGLCLDGDAAGERGIRRGLKGVFAALRTSDDLRLIRLPPGLDPDDLVGAGEQAADFVKRYEDAPTVGQFLLSLSPEAGQAPEEKARRLEEVLAELGNMPDSLLKNALLGELAQRAGLPFQAVERCLEQACAGRRTTSKSQEPNNASPVEAGKDNALMQDSRKG